MLARQFFTKLAKSKVSPHNNRINTIYYTRRSGFVLGFVIRAVKFRLVGMVINVLCKRYTNSKNAVFWFSSAIEPLVF